MRNLVVAFLFTFSSLLGHAEALNPDQKAKVEKKLEALKAWGTDAKVVELVKAGNAKVSDVEKAMTQEKWKAATVFDSVVRGCSSNELQKYIASKKGDDVTEAFVSRADGSKLAFLSKTTNWSHKGKPKHDNPMAGNTWIGEAEKDESTGKMQVQVSFPVLDGTTPIGSIVVGLDLGKL